MIGRFFNHMFDVLSTILYIKATCLSVTDVLGGGGRESPVKGGPSTGASTGGGGGSVSIYCIPSPLKYALT